MGKGASLRYRVHNQFDPKARQEKGLSTVNRFVIGMILAATVLAIIETEPAIMLRYGPVLLVTELTIGTMFALEYAIRFWIAPERHPGRPAWRERFRFVVSPSAIADAIAIVSSFAIVGGTSAILLRWIRLGRIVRMAKLGRMSRAFDHIVVATISRRDELLLSLTAGLTLMIGAATALYLAEGAVQPDKFGSIPRALWWSVATLTTIGYGDVYPITPLGKCLAGLTAIFSIGLIAMPTGILAAAFSDAVQRHQAEISDATSHRNADGDGDKS